MTSPQLCARNRGDRRIREGRRDHYVALGCYFSGYCAGSGAFWVYRHCRGGGGSCEISLFPIPGCLPGTFYCRNERGKTVVGTCSSVRTRAEARRRTGISVRLGWWLPVSVSAKGAVSKQPGAPP